MPRLLKIVSTAALLAGAVIPLIAGSQEPVNAEDEIRVLVERLASLEQVEGSEEVAKEIETLVARLAAAEGAAAADVDVLVKVDGDGERKMKRVVKVKTDGDSEPVVLWMENDSSDPGDAVVRVIGADGKEIVTPKRAFLGVSTMSLSQDLLDHFGVAQETGYLVSSVEPDSAALRAGIEVGDVLTAIDGDPIGGKTSLARAIAKREPGDNVDVELWRDGRLQTVAATLGEHENLPLVRRIEVAADCAPGEECGENVFVVGTEPRTTWVTTCADGEDCTSVGRTLIIEEREDD